MMKLLLVRRVLLSLREITAVAGVLILLHDKSITSTSTITTITTVNCFSPGLVLSNYPLSKGALARLNRSSSKSDQSHHQSQQHQQSQYSSSSLLTETQLSCFACGRYASYSLWDGGVVAQEPITLEKFRKDYQLSPYRINRVSLDITIIEEETEKTTTTKKKKGEAASGDDDDDDDITLVKSIMNVSPQSISTSTSTTSVPVPLELDGEDLELRYIALNGKELIEKDDYVLTEAGGLIILEPPREFTSTSTSTSSTGTGTGASISNSFTLETLVAIKPQKNTQLSGLYKSNGMYVTQCEAQGFRRITYFQDRPDIMATYDVRIEANKENYPVLLSNGNAMDKGDIILEEGEEGKGRRHWAKFVDPFPKPSYLFAIVAGDLGKMEGSFQTMSDRDIQLSVWSEPENVDQLDWAMKSLKDAMKFDEETYGREYDLDVYNIVAVNDFNMGAMENKGLNIFNTAAILAKPSTATDRDYERVQGVVGHEYFHNWSGNRVTCRDWFQLTLKEGLTVFRDQHFSEDMTSQAVKRIEDVRVVRSAQFVQDAGPMAHPIRPESYIAMDNFYTVTVYNKGAEVIRMYRTLLGRETFRKAMDLYFERHDGQAVTCDDFRRAMADASTRDLTQFENWYLQAGTPVVKAISSSSSSASNNNNEGEEEYSFTLTLSQSMVSTASNDHQPTTTTTKQDPFHIPIVVAILGKNKNSDSDGNSVLVEQTLELTEETQTFVFPNLSGEPYVASINRGFSSPIKLETDYTEDQIAFLAANDNDPFNRWDASQQLYTREILRYVKEYQQQDNNDNDCIMTLSDSVNDAFRSTLSDSNLDPSLRAYSLLLPTFATLSQEMSPIDADAILAATKSLRRNLASRNKKQLLQMYHSLSQEEGEKYEVNKKQVGNRRLRNTCLSILSTLSNDDDDIIDLCYKQFESATSMTDSTAALECLADIPSSSSSMTEKALGIFYDGAKKNNEALVINKWLAIQAAADLPNAVEKVKALTKHEGYESTNPNSIRSLLQMFASANPGGFHNSDGSGYKFIADQVIDIDRRNPQVAARLASSFDTWSKHTEERKQLMKIQLERIQNGSTSPDTLEIVSRSLQA